MSKVFSGNIGSIRAVEDTIRTTRKYTEGIGTMGYHHPIQGTEFSSKMFVKYYEVYPYININWGMPAGQAADLLWGDARRIDVVLRYDYRVNRATMSIKEGDKAIVDLVEGIPGFKEALDKVIVEYEVQKEMESGKSIEECTTDDGKLLPGVYPN